MHICVIGTGASGLISACEISNLEFVSKVSIIGSSKIPSIKVGESSTIPFSRFIKKNFDISEFVRSTDATVKYGVYYKNWGKNDFLHFFGSNKQFDRHNTVEKAYCELLANKDEDVHFHDLVSKKLWDLIQKNEVSLDFDEHPHSWQFDAGKFKIFLKNHLKKNKKVNFFDDTIIDCSYYKDKSINCVIGESGKKYNADYFVNCSGDNELNSKVFKEEYVSLSKYLLTNKAVVYPVNFKNKKDQFTPYTTAKTMKCGWRWIIPTQSRIGTGYVFSDKHISVDEACNDFIKEVGDESITPFFVDFNPKYSTNPFKKNSCSLGMSAGFLEPLDSSGIAFAIIFLDHLIHLLTTINDKNPSEKYKKDMIDYINYKFRSDYQWWCSFILHQYKTCSTIDNEFWRDHKNVKCDFYDKIIEKMENLSDDILENFDYQMLFKTNAGRDIKWESIIKEKPFPIKELDVKSISHQEYIKNFYG